MAAPHHPRRHRPRPRCRPPARGPAGPPGRQGPPPQRPAEPPEPLGGSSVSVAIDHRQRRAGEPAGSFASAGGGAILVDMTATLTSPTFVGRTEELARLAAAGRPGRRRHPDGGAGRRRGRGRQDPAGRRAGRRGPRRRRHRAGRRLRRAGRRGVCPSRPWSRPCGRSSRDLDEPALARLLPGHARAELARLLPELGPPAARPGAGGVRGDPGLVGAGAAVRAAAGAAGAPGRATAGPCWWWRTCTGPTARPATCSPSWSATCATAACCWCSPTAATSCTAATRCGRSWPSWTAAAGSSGWSWPASAGRGAAQLAGIRGDRSRPSWPGGSTPAPAATPSSSRSCWPPPAGDRAAAEPARHPAGPDRAAGRAGPAGAGGGGGGRSRVTTSCWPRWPACPRSCWRLREAVSAHVLLADAGERHLRVPPRPGQGGGLRRAAAGGADPPARPVRGRPGRQPGLADDPALAAELAWHWYAAHDLERALPAAVAAGLAAERAYAFAEAQRQFERALELWERGGEPAAEAGMDKAELLARAGRGGRQRRRRRPGGRPGPRRPGRGRPGRRAAAGRPAHRAPGLPPADRRPAGGVRGLPGGGPAGPAGADGGPGPGPGRPGPGADAAGPLRRGRAGLRGGDRGGQGGRRPGGRGPRPQQPRHRPGPPGRPRGRAGPAGGGPAPAAELGAAKD